MGGEQIASAGKVVETRLNALQFPPAAANAVILLAVTLLIIVGLNHIVDVRKEL
jgi:putative spermidine/putrescine transport system permease protein